jgi:hypothetical protein
MKGRLSSLLIPLLITILILIVLEIFSTTFLPIIGLKNYIIPFNIMIVLFLGLKLETPYLAIFILVVQYFHSFFSIEGWEMGTIAGIIVCLVISQLRDLIHLSSAAITVLMTFLFGWAWFLVVSVLFYLKFGDMHFVTTKFWRFLPEVIVISFSSPFFFSLLDKVWKADENGYLGDEG